jgi:hypothetical protein
MNKYEKWYNSLIQTRKNLSRSKNLGEYFEAHHILPQSLGGNNSPNNLILLTAREHFIAHILLAKIYKDSNNRHKMLTAVIRMAQTSKTHNQNRYFNSRLYEMIRKDFSREISLRMTKNNPSKNGLSEEHKKKISESLKGRKFSDDHKKKLSSVQKGRTDPRSVEGKLANALASSTKLKGKKKPPGFAEAIGKRMRGTKRDNIAKQKMKDAWTEERKQAQSERTRLQNSLRSILTCPHCGKEGTNSGNMNRYHFGACKHVSELQAVS